MGRLDQKVAVITGGARGIGREIALTFAREGADIVLGDVIDMAEAAQGIKNLGRKAVTVKTDISKKAEVNNLIDTAVAQFKKIDILVNNAGISSRVPLMELTEEIWDRLMNINLKGVFLCTQAAARHMIERKYGKIINMSSIDGLTACNDKVAYGISKAGVIQLTRLSARALGPYGINVNAIAPGQVTTDMSRAERTQEEVERRVAEALKQVALRRAATTQDMANLALFLASDEASFITGQVISSDGGLYGLR